MLPLQFPAVHRWLLTHGMAHVLRKNTLNLPMQVTLEQITRPRTFLCLHVRSHRTCQPHRYGNMDGLYADDSRGGHIAHGKLVSLEKMPMLIGSSASLPQALRKTDDEQLSFSYTGSVYPTQKEALRLIPFFRLHDSRYAIYFHQVSEARWKASVKKWSGKSAKPWNLPTRQQTLFSPESNNRNPIMASGTNRRKPEPTETVISDAPKAGSATL